MSDRPEPLLVPRTLPAAGVVVLNSTISSLRVPLVIILNLSLTDALNFCNETQLDIKRP